MEVDALLLVRPIDRQNVRTKKREEYSVAGRISFVDVFHLFSFHSVSLGFNPQICLLPASFIHFIRGERCL
jgi:hypothetical protein